MERSKRNTLSLSAPFFFWFLICLLGPLVFIVATSFATRGVFGQVIWDFTLQAYEDLLNPVYLKIVYRTLLFALSNMFLVLLMAYPFAYFVTRREGKTRILWLLLVLVPSWTNCLIRTHAISDFLRLKPFGLDWLFTAQGVLFTMVSEYLPLGILPLYASLAKVENPLIEAARDLGANSWDVFWKVLLPLTKTGLLAAGIFVFIPSLGEFLIPELVGGGRYFVLGNFLHNQFLVVRNWSLGSAFLTLLLVLTFIAVLFSGEQKREHA